MAKFLDLDERIEAKFPELDEREEKQEETTRQGWTEYKRQRLNMRERTARLRALRLTRQRAQRGRQRKAG